MTTLMVVMRFKGCNFDNGLCSSWSQSDLDDFEWTNWNGPTFSLDTGPSYDHTGNG